MEQPFEDVPEHLRDPLYEWIVSAFQVEGSRGVSRERVHAVALDMRLPSSGDGTITLGRWRDESRARPTVLLDVVESILAVLPQDSKREVLAGILDRANSIYALDDGRTHLEMRVAAGVKESVSSTAAAAPGAAGDHLIQSWNAAYGRHADPVKAYSEAIKAVEAALAPHVSPANARQTLGTMIRDVSGKPTKWGFVLSGDAGSVIEGTVLGMMRTLWNGQTSRHGGLGPTRAESPEQARAAVHLAAALVQFGVSGAFHLSGSASPGDVDAD